MYRLVLAAVLLALVNGEHAPVIQPRIIGGDRTDIQSYPYMLSVRVFDKHKCGGAILSRKHFITAAQCLSTLPTLPLYYKVRVGSSFREQGGELIVVEKCVKHPNYLHTQVYWDVAVGTLQKPLDFSADGSTMQPISLVAANQAPDSLLTVSGWGPTRAKIINGQHNDTDADRINVVTLVLAPRSECTIVTYRRQNPITVHLNDTVICAGGLDGDALVNVYKSDVGGPLVNTEKKLVGIATTPRAAPNLHHPGIFSNLAEPAINKFITDNIHN